MLGGVVFVEKEERKEPHYNSPDNLWLALLERKEKLSFPGGVYPRPLVPLAWGLRMPPYASVSPVNHARDPSNARPGYSPGKL
jgi:hypothetical protein